MTFPCYPKYKASGFLWLGDVPELWTLKRLGHYFEERRERASDTEFEPLSVTKNGIVPRLESAAKTQDGDNRKKVLAGDFVINSRSDRKGSSGLSPLDGSVSLICTVLIPTELHGPYIHHLFRSELFQEEYYRWGKGIVADLWSTNFSDMKNIVLGVPSEEEQAQIARFLDHETARIDALIEEQQRLIELLKEKRQAVISQAVTKGLDPTVPMKDSGVEWLGVVPAHWIVRKGGYIGMLFGSEAVPEDMVNESGNLPFLKVGSLSADTLSIRQWDFFVDPSIEKAYRPRSQFVVFPKRGAAIFLNKVNVVEVSALLDPNLMGWEMEAGNDAYYFANVLKCRGLAELADVSTVPQINNKHISPEKFPVPPSGEQHDIVAFLDTEVSRFDQLVTEAENGVSLLIDRRSALISAAVTGKIDVRGWQPPASAPTPELAQEAV